jgi:hypothetical protein
LDTSFANEINLHRRNRRDLHPGAEVSLYAAHWFGVTDTELPGIPAQYRHFGGAGYLVDLGLMA